MDFIERTLGIAPDAGSGSFELVLLTVACACVVYVLRRRLRAPDASRPLRP